MTVGCLGRNGGGIGMALAADCRERVCYSEVHVYICMHIEGYSGEREREGGREGKRRPSEGANLVCEGSVHADSLVDG